ncbi:hypothetical protein FA15DRAFT_596298 [Coprinopsis marcescibilis]|uniref:CASTOR ACT domain-containing protein n=1 Tax=Coprinopsis marcescibilis TaxID=230819 RepID=A0A5C3L258_COPMA|nr:hypothetical protein FA15DRAFT_596298 [Coprinopsis marcescibilis]
MQVTISLLPVSLSLVHIPRSRLSQVSHPILRQIIHPNPVFLNITCNDIELSIFAEEHMLDDFEPIARKDRYRQRSRSGSNPSANRRTAPDFNSVEISCERWSVLQIDSHSDQMDNSGARVRELSAPLAAAGISILYQSSYMSDFIFVKESRLQDALSLFNTAGFDLYSPDPSLLQSLPLSPPDTPSTEGPSSPTVQIKPKTSAETSTSPSDGSSRRKSHSPTAGEVRILEPDLACVGLSDEFGVDHWGLKIVKLVAFPDLIPPTGSPPRSRLASQNSSLTDCSQPPSRSSLYEASSPTSLKMSRPFTTSTSSSSSSEDDGYFSYSPQIRPVSPPSHSRTTSRSHMDLPGTMSPLQPASRHFTSPYSLSAPQKPKAEPVSFFSFTRTPEGSSLTADVHVLATLFPPHERHMVICGEELDLADKMLEGDVDSDEEEDEVLNSTSTMQKCLQIDLRRFGLDKHGLVNRFSRVLEKNGINHMYSSTFKTANLLVDKKHAMRAQSLLRSC